MPQLTQQVDSDGEHVWLTMDGQRLVPLRIGDQEGLKAATTWLVDGQVVSAAEAAAVRGVTPQTVEACRAIYATTGQSTTLVDRRHFSAGQQTAYRMGFHKPRLIRQAMLNLLQGQRNSGRRLAEQLGEVVDDRTVDRHLHEMGWRAAEAAGLCEEVAACLDAERKRAYWAGVEGAPLERVLTSSSLREWQLPQYGWVGVALGTVHLTLNGVWESLKRLTVIPVPVLSQWPALRVWYVLLVYLLASGGARVSQAKHFAWQQVQGLLSGCRRLSATSLRGWLVAVAQMVQQGVSVCR